MFNVEVNYEKGNKKSDSASSVSFVTLNMYGISVQLGPKLEVRVRKIYMRILLRLLIQNGMIFHRLD